MHQETTHRERFLVRAFYKFFDFADYEAMREPILDCCKKNGVRGSILLSSEGLNSTVSGTKAGVEALFDFFKGHPGLSEITYKDSWADEIPFRRMLVKLKKEIVTFHQGELADPRKHVGAYVKPKDWNQLITEPEVVVIDTRNDYEVEIGTFRNAINPKTESFTEFADYMQRNYKVEEQPKFAMCCTGGIRCEKATAYLLSLGYKNVYHLEGGILKYLEDVPESESLWEGECFVFDKRVSVNHQLEKGKYELCYACNHILMEDDLKSEKYQGGVSCPYCFDALTEEKKRGYVQRQREMRVM